MTQWVASLLAAWIEADRIGARVKLGYPAVSGPWRTLADDDDDGRQGGFTGAEVRAVGEVMDWLRCAHHAEWFAVHAALGGHAVSLQLLKVGLARIGAKLDEVLGG